MQARKDWFGDKWFYGMVKVEIFKSGIPLHWEILGGIEVNYPNSDNNYLMDAANDLLPEALECAKKELKNVIAKLQA